VSIELEFLADEAPAWAAIVKRSNSGLRFSAQPARAGGSRTRLYRLVARTNTFGSVVVSEEVLGDLLPKFCPQRHINLGGSFCLGLRAGEGINTRGAAGAWWRKLHLYLSCQEAAKATGFWPSSAQLSHGDAAELQIAAEQLATALGREEDYKCAMQYDRGMLFVDVVNYETARNALRNGRVVCHCQTPGMSASCPRRSYDCLVALETKRRELEGEFWTDLSGQSCCRTMKNCPIKGQETVQSHADR
jgi:hypothetical protein